MSFRASLFKRSCLGLVLVGCMVTHPAKAQTKDAPIAFADQDAVTATFVTAPVVSTDSSGGGGGEPGKWLKIEFHFHTTNVVARTYPFVDAVQFKVWIEGFDLYAKDTPPGAKGVSIALTGEETYINVPVSNDAYGVFFVDPAVIARYTSDRGPDDFDRKFNVHVEAYVNGALVDYSNKRKETDALGWFKPLRAVPGLVSRMDQTPFLLSGGGRYPMLKPIMNTATP